MSRDQLTPRRSAHTKRLACCAADKRYTRPDGIRHSGLWSVLFATVCLAFEHVARANLLMTTDATNGALPQMIQLVLPSELTAESVSQMDGNSGVGSIGYMYQGSMAGMQLQAPDDSTFTNPSESYIGPVSAIDVEYSNFHGKVLRLLLNVNEVNAYDPLTGDFTRFFGGEGASPSFPTSCGVACAYSALAVNPFDGTVHVAEYHTGIVLSVAADGSGYVTHPATVDSQLNTPLSLEFNPFNGMLYAGDYGTVRQLSSTTSMTILAGTAGSVGVVVPGVGAAASFGVVQAITVSTDGTMLYCASNLYIPASGEVVGQIFSLDLATNAVSLIAGTGRAFADAPWVGSGKNSNVYMSKITDLDLDVSGFLVALEAQCSDFTVLRLIEPVASGVTGMVFGGDFLVPGSSCGSTAIPRVRGLVATRRLCDTVLDVITPTAVAGTDCPSFPGGTYSSVDLSGVSRVVVTAPMRIANTLTLADNATIELDAALVVVGDAVLTHSAQLIVRLGGSLTIEGSLTCGPNTLLQLAFTGSAEELVPIIVSGELVPDGLFVLVSENARLEVRERVVVLRCGSVRDARQFAGAALSRQFTRTRAALAASDIELECQATQCEASGSIDTELVPGPPVRSDLISTRIAAASLAALSAYLLVIVLVVGLVVGSQMRARNMKKYQAKPHHWTKVSAVQMVLRTHSIVGIFLARRDPFNRRNRAVLLVFGVLINVIVVAVIPLLKARAYEKANFQADRVLDTIFAIIVSTLAQVCVGFPIIVKLATSDNPQQRTLAFHVGCCLISLLIVICALLIAMPHWVSDSPIQGLTLFVLWTVSYFISRLTSEPLALLFKFFVFGQTHVPTFGSKGSQSLGGSSGYTQTADTECETETEETKTVLTGSSSASEQ